ncbi:cyclin-D6-1-like [Hordeum vulgare subsp. vulgare]|uniref:cyclin-D6-1-like n=1 Tax=Hordeum vulgare subsp. vulgare TaxID=112509 RepID=UPI001D1A5A93|nr:cyclin-D6-1-like [Hordeum vulgare subsp. vulgare]
MVASSPPIKPEPAVLGVFLPLPRTDAMDMPGEDEYVYGYEYEFDLENPFTSPADEPIASLLDAEGHHAPFVSAAAFAVRCDTARFISKVRYDGELGLHPRVAYLAQNYVDRFLSKGQLPFERKPWAPRLLAISSVSGAALSLHQPLGGPFGASFTFLPNHHLPVDLLDSCNGLLFYRCYHVSHAVTTALPPRKVELPRVASNGKAIG